MIPRISEPEQQMLLSWAGTLGAPVEVAQGRLTAPARAAADWIARRFGLDNRVVRLLVTTFCREVHRYLTDPARRHAVRATVADTIEAHRPAVVLAHSLGSVVAYETLWAHTHLQIDLLLTLGSPLALPDVVFPGSTPPPWPERAAGPRGCSGGSTSLTPVTSLPFPARLGGYFDGIDADLTTPIGVFNFHKVAGYLSCTTTAAALATLLGR